MQQLRQFSIRYFLIALALASLTHAAAKPEAPKPGWLNQNPPDAVSIDSGRRNPLFYVGEDIAFTLKGPAADRFEVRDFWGDLVDKGPAAASLKLKAQPPGWYKLYVFGKPVAQPAVDKRTDAEKELTEDKDKAKEADAQARQDLWQYRQWYGDAVGGTTFVVFRDDPHFPKLSAAGKFPHPDLFDEVMRGVSGMGPQRYSANAAKPEETIKNLEQEIATDRALYLPFDPARHRVLMMAFPDGTKGHLDGVKKIVEHFMHDVTYFEPRNEPNGGSNGTDFVKNEMIDFYQTVKAVDPKLKVLGPGNVTINPGPNGLGFIEDFLKADGAKYIDALSFHIYNGINGDLWLVRQSMDALTALLKKYNAGDKELWQTEQGYFACVYGAYQPHHQANWTMLEMMAFEQYGLPKEHNHLWYDVSHGFWDFPTWWENDDHSFNPALPLMRVWSEELFGTHFARRLDLGANGNRLYLASEFEGDHKHVAAFMSDGLTDGSVDLKITGGSGKLHVVSAFGVEKDLPISAGHVMLPVPELPVYVELSGGQKLEATPQDFGKNLARDSGVALVGSGTGKHPVDPKIPNDLSKLNDGEMQNWYWTQKAAQQPWMDDTKSFPAWVEMSFAKPTEVGRVVMYSATPWQWQGVPVDFELQSDDGGKWTTIQHIVEPLKTMKVVTPTLRCKADSFFSDRHVFNIAFKPITTGKLRLLVHNTTFGGGATDDVVQAGGQTGPHQLMLREIEVYAQ